VIRETLKTWLLILLVMTFFGLVLGIALSYDLWVKD
jgi:hypothetical protein